MNMDMTIGNGARKEFIDAGTLKEIEAAALAAANKDENDEKEENQNG